MELPTEIVLAGSRVETTLAVFSKHWKRLQGCDPEVGAKINYLETGMTRDFLACLVRHGILRSVRGLHGGYQLPAHFDTLSLFDLAVACGETKVVDTPAGAMYGFVIKRSLRNVRIAELMPDIEDPE